MNSLTRILKQDAARRERLKVAPTVKDAAWALAEIDRLNVTLSAFAQKAQRDAVRDEETLEVLRAADDDIREHLQVARYNLTGMTHLGDQMPIPNPPRLIHQAGIDASDAVRRRIKQHIRLLKGTPAHS